MSDEHQPNQDGLVPFSNRGLGGNRSSLVKRGLELVARTPEETGKRDQEQFREQRNKDKVADLIHFAEQAEQELQQWEQCEPQLLHGQLLEDWFGRLESPFYNVFMLTFCKTVRPWIDARPAGDLKRVLLERVIERADTIAGTGKVKRTDYLAFERDVKAVSQEHPAFFDSDDSCEGDAIHTPIDILRQIEKVVGRPALEEIIEQLRVRTFTLIEKIENARRNV